MQRCTSSLKTYRHSRVNAYTGQIFIVVTVVHIALISYYSVIHMQTYTQVTKWLSFGGEYLREVLTVLGPDHMTNVMRSFSQFEKVASGLTDILRNHY